MLMLTVQTQQNLGLCFNAARRNLHDLGLLEADLVYTQRKLEVEAGG
jgi:hypothetical protein